MSLIGRVEDGVCGNGMYGMFYLPSGSLAGKHWSIGEFEFHIIAGVDAPKEAVDEVVARPENKGKELIVRLELKDALSVAQASGKYPIKHTQPPWMDSIFGKNK